MSGTTLRRVARLQRGAGFPHDRQGVAEAELPFFKVGDFGSPGNERQLKSCDNWVSLETARELRASVVPAGSVLLPKIGAALLGNARRITEQPSVFDNNVLAVVPTRVEHPYLYYWLSTLDLGELANPGPIPSLADSALLDLAIPCGDIERQRQIADFLDAETCRIDGLISKKHRLAELVKIRRSTFIGRVVTRGVGTQVSLEPTGNPFAPEVLGNWKVMRLRHVVTDIVDTAHKTAPVVEGGQYLVVRTANVKRGRLMLNGAHYTDAASWREWTTRAVPKPGDVMFTREAPAGEACLVPASPDLCIGRRMVLLRVDEATVSGRWLVHSIYSGPAEQFIALLTRSTTVAHLNMSDISDIPIVVPSRDEQEALLRQIEEEDARSTALNYALQQQIALLQEHRQALITAAVDGRLRTLATDGHA